MSKFQKVERKEEKGKFKKEGKGEGGSLKREGGGLSYLIFILLDFY